MEFKVVISDPETGKSYQKEIKEGDAKKLNNKKIREEIAGDILGLVGYKLELTGGSDKGGFPMKKGIHDSVRRVLMSEGTGYKPDREVRKRKRVRGEVVTEDITQINTKIVSRGRKTVEELLGIKKGNEEKAEAVEKVEVEKPVASKREGKEVKGKKKTHTLNENKKK